MSLKGCRCESTSRRLGSSQRILLRAGMRGTPNFDSADDFGDFGSPKDDREKREDDVSESLEPNGKLDTCPVVSVS